ncbi:hypothetical protein [Sorangium cellulosum]|nr:hypothetical protein [Sorangium cellulosum]
MTLSRMVLVGCLSLVGSALAACANSDADRLGEGNGNVVVSPPTSEGDGCTLTQGYWKNHEESWPVSSLTIGGETYSQAELLEIFRTPPKGDASLILGHQLIAALLNTASGASDAALDGALADVEAWMAANKDTDDGRLPYGVKRGGAADEAVSLSGTLADFNEGGIGPGHCDDGPGSGSGSTGSGSGSTGGGDDCGCGGDPGDGSGSTGTGSSDGGEGGGCSHGGEGGEGGSDGSEGGEGGSSGDPSGGEGGSGSEGPVCSDPCSDGCADGYVCILGCCAFVPN